MQQHTTHRYLLLIPTATYKPTTILYSTILASRFEERTLDRALPYPIAKVIFTQATLVDEGAIAQHIVFRSISVYTVTGERLFYTYILEATVPDPPAPVSAHRPVQIAAHYSRLPPFPNLHLPQIPTYHPQQPHFPDFHHTSNTMQAAWQPRGFNPVYGFDEGAAPPNMMPQGQPPFLSQACYPGPPPQANQFQYQMPVNYPPMVINGRNPLYGGLINMPGMTL